MDQGIPTPSFEQSLENDLHTLAGEIQNRRGAPAETVAETASEHELVKEAIRAFPAPERIPSSLPVAAPTGVPAPSNSNSTAAFANPLPDYAQNASPEVKLEIEYLLELAFNQGLGKALAQSDKSPYFVQDAFHDALAGKLYPELQKRGIVK